MDEARAVDRVLAVVTRVMMTAGSIQGSLAHIRKELRAGVNRRRDLRRIILVHYRPVVRHRRPGEWIGRRWPRHTRGRGMTNPMLMPRIRHSRIGAATLVVQTKRISARERHRNSTINQKWQRCSQAGYHQPVLARGVEVREVS